ncbi:winged helix-turn-helix domain-containing protein [Edaphobacter albus]|uniref:winged helix-turn-helix domain-containing protein n=1 Tax=Edaphobacter sp. 4G125 TaxID=2763071 RepID=UPI0016456037|nr:winged helix-turn-helix domain-containing protein [Edaphobacter sp. 4G125]QNI36640.1 winged helix-turn-helix domain-containing protein [Edaphobacter sp. 4G125]
MNDTARIFLFGPFSFDLAQQELRRRTRRVHLSVSLLKLLTLFLTRHGELITREEIALTLWEDSNTIDVVTGINTAVRRLRAQLDDDPATPTYIETVIGLGYRFIAPVEEIEDSRNTDHERPPVQEVVTLEEADLNTAALVESPSESGEDTSWKAQPPLQTERHRFMSPRILFGVATLLLLALGAAAMRHRSARLAASPGGTSHLSPSLTQITFNDEENRITSEAISPDGQLVAYSDRYGISVHNLGDGTDHLLTSPSSFQANRLAWHPGRNWLLVSGSNLLSHRSEVWVVYLHGEVPHLLVDDAGLAVASPDGNHIAYTRAGNSEIWLADEDGENAHLLIPKRNRDRFTCLLWSPEGDRLIDDRVSAASDPSTNSAGADPSPRSTYESVDVRTGKLLSKQENIQFDSGFLLKDGRFFHPEKTGDFDGAKIMMIPTDRSTGQFLSHPQAVSTSQVPDVWGPPGVLSASSNGNWIGTVLSSRTSDVYVAEIHWPGPTLIKATRLTDHSRNNYPHTWTPNGDAVLFDRNDRNAVIGKERLGEAKMEVVAQLPNIAAMAEFSPDGKWILFTEFAGSPSHAVGIFSVPSEGGKPTQLHTTGTIEEFHCPTSSKGSCVMRETNDNQESVFYALDPVQGMQQEVARIPWEPNILGDWSVSPDGAIVAIANHDPENPDIQLVPLSPHRSIQPSTIPVPGFGAMRGVTWASDAKGFFVETKTTTSYNLLYVNQAGHVTLLRQSPIAIWGVPSRDGKKLAFPSLTVTSNVWAGRTSPP